MSANAILKLQSVGFTAEQVGALAELVDSQAATKPDLEAVEHRLEAKIADLKLEIAGVEHRLETKIAGVETRLETKIAGVESRLEAKIADVKHDIAGVESRLETKIAQTHTSVILWLVGTAVGTATIGAAIAGFVFKHIP